MSGSGPSGGDPGVVVAVRVAPTGSDRAAEALRMAVGLTLDRHRPLVLLLGDGVRVLSDPDPVRAGGKELRKPLETLRALECPVAAEKAAIDRHGVPVPDWVESFSESRVRRAFGRARVVIAIP